MTGARCLLAGDSASAKKASRRKSIMSIFPPKRLQDRVGCWLFTSQQSHFTIRLRALVFIQIITNEKKTHSAQVCVESFVVCQDNKFHYCFFIVSAQSYGNRNRLRFESRVCAAHSSSTAWENLRKLIGITLVPLVWLIDWGNSACSSDVRRTRSAPQYTKSSLEACMESFWYSFTFINELFTSFVVV